ncbi:unnamed protein product, partial [Mesorhabditis spiculigera]
MKTGCMIRGRRILLVPYEKELVKKYHNWMENEELREQTASTRLTLDEEYAMQEEWMRDENKATFIILESGDVQKTFEDAMIGDINLFIDEENRCRAELSVMIAEPTARRKGYASEAVRLMIAFGARRLNLTEVFVKIGDENKDSIAMFKRLGFEVVQHSDVFQETELAAPESIVKDFGEFFDANATVSDV